MLRVQVPVTMGLKPEGSPLHKNVPLVILPWYVCAGIPPLATAGVLAKINTAAKQARSTAVAKRRCDRRGFRFNQQFVFIQTTKGTGIQSSEIFLETSGRRSTSCHEMSVGEPVFKLVAGAKNKHAVGR